MKTTIKELPLAIIGPAPYADPNRYPLRQEVVDLLAADVEKLGPQTDKLVVWESITGHFGETNYCLVDDGHCLAAHQKVLGSHAVVPVTVLSECKMEEVLQVAARHVGTRVRHDARVHMEIVSRVLRFHAQYPEQSPLAPSPDTQEPRGGWHYAPSVKSQRWEFAQGKGSEAEDEALYARRYTQRDLAAFLGWVKGDGVTPDHVFDGAFDALRLEEEQILAIPPGLGTSQAQAIAHEVDQQKFWFEVQIERETTASERCEDTGDEEGAEAHRKMAARRAHEAEITLKQLAANLVQHFNEGGGVRTAHRITERTVGSRKKLAEVDIAIFMDQLRAKLDSYRAKIEPKMDSLVECAADARNEPGSLAALVASMFTFEEYLRISREKLTAPPPPPEKDATPAKLPKALPAKKAKAKV